MWAILCQLPCSQYRCPRACIIPSAIEAMGAQPCLVPPHLYKIRRIPPSAHPTLTGSYIPIRRPPNRHCRCSPAAGWGDGVTRFRRKTVRHRRRTELCSPKHSGRQRCNNGAMMSSLLSPHLAQCPSTEMRRLLHERWFRWCPAGPCAMCMRGGRWQVSSGQRACRAGARRR